MVNEAYTERQAIEQDIAKLRSAEQDFRFKFRQLLEGYLRQIEETPEVTAPAQAPRRAGLRAPRRGRQRGHRARVGRRRPRPPGAEAERAAPEPPRTAPSSPWPTRPRDRRARRPGRRGRAGAGRGGVQAGAQPRREEPARRPRHDHGPAAARFADDPEATAARSAAPGRRGREPAESRERIVFGETDDLLADVDTGVNENEFKW